MTFTTKYWLRRIISCLTFDFRIKTHFIGVIGNNPEHMFDTTNEFNLKHLPLIGDTISLPLDNGKSYSFKVVKRELNIIMKRWLIYLVDEENQKHQ